MWRDGVVSRPGWFGKQHSKLVTDGSTATKRIWRRSGGRAAALTAGGAALVLVAGVVIVAVGAPGSHAAPVSAAHHSMRAQPAPALQVLSVTPAAGAQGVNGADPIRVQFSAPLAASTPMPQLSPHIAGSWQVEGDTAVFTPAVGYFQDTRVTLKIPGGPAGMISVGGASAGAGGLLASGVTQSFTTGSFSTLRLQELLAQLGYLPLTWTSESSSVISPGNTKTELAAAYDPPGGTFSWQSSYPSELTNQWQAGAGNMLDVGAIRAFESVHGLTMDGEAGYAVWSDLFTAAAKGQHDPNGYTYALVNQNQPESITIWHNGHEVLNSPVNTGIPASPTVDGTFPVYLRFYFTYMSGFNPGGSYYDDPVWYVSYFNGGDAVHYFPRGGYGYNQSLGCVELPWDQAAHAYPYLTYGSLVTVTGPVGG
jgi:peptidoglycan hydrolase-like protein with peptidoglycan-binding domain